MNDKLTKSQQALAIRATLNAVEGRTLLRLAKDGSLRPGLHYGNYTTPDALRKLHRLELVERTLLGFTCSKAMVTGVGVQKSKFWGYVLTDAGMDMAIDLGAGQ